MKKQKNENTAVVKSLQDTINAGKQLISEIRILAGEQMVRAMKFGELLIEIKTVAPRGSFGKICEEEFNLERTTASRYMNVFRNRELWIEKNITELTQAYNYYKENSYSGSTNIDLPIPTAYTPQLIEHATFLLKRIFRTGLKYKKAGVMFNDISPDTGIQQNLFVEAPDPRQKNLMQLMDTLNKEHGANTVRIATMGTDQKWKMKQDMRSPRYTTRWSERLVVNV